MQQVATNFLQNIRVLDVSRLLPAPLATMLLADMGAEVIKIEDPSNPDPIRNYPPFIENNSAYFLAVNRGKKSLALSLQNACGLKVLYELVKTCNVFIESFRPGIAKKIGIDYDTLKLLKPDIIYISLTGYGQFGEYAQKAGHDLNYLGYSGILSLNKDDNGKPVIPGIQIADIVCGSQMAVNACLGAIIQQLKTGRGCYLDVSMVDASLMLLSLPMAAVWATQHQQLDSATYSLLTGALMGNLLNYNVYKCKDEKYVVLGALEPKFWIAFCEGVQHPEWVKEMPTAGNVALKKEIESVFLLKTRLEWIEFANSVDCCLTPVYELNEVENDVHIKSRNVVSALQHTGYGSYKVFRNSLQVAGNNNLCAAPLLGEHTFSVLKFIGYTESQINELVKDGIVK